jgi:outer membrane biosynthesis protein TonB
MSFEAPWLLAGLLLVPLAAVGYWLLMRRHTRYAVRFTNLELLAAVAGQRRSWLRHLPAALLLASLAACGGGGSKAKPVEPTPTPTEPTPVAKTEAPPEESKPAPEPEPPKPDPEQLKKEAMDAETAAFEKAKPVFEGFCKSCHFKGQKNASAKKLGEFDMTAYPFGGKHNKAADIRKVLGIGGGKATMPKTKPGSVKGDDLAAISAWADAYDAAETAGAHPAAAEPAKK